MKKPIYDSEQRLDVYLNTMYGDILLLRLEWLKFVRELKKLKFFKYLILGINRILRIINEI